jgi:hypothetical protein
MVARIFDINRNALLAAGELFDNLANISVAPSNVSITSLSNTESSIFREAARTSIVAIKTCRNENQLTTDRVRTVATSLRDESIAFRARVVMLDGISPTSLTRLVARSFRTSCRNGRQRKNSRAKYSNSRYCLTLSGMSEQLLVAVKLRKF